MADTVADRQSPSATVTLSHGPGRSNEANTTNTTSADSSTYGRAKP